MPKTLLLLLAAVGLLANCDTGHSRQKAADDVLADSYRRVCDDAVKQYEIAKRNGSKIDTCVQAGFAAAAFLQAKDETGYAEWKRVESTDCARAGVPR